MANHSTLPKLHTVVMLGMMFVAIQTSSALDSRRRALISPPVASSFGKKAIWGEQELRDAYVLGKHDAILKLRGGSYSEDEIVAEAFDWLCNLGAPAALVAGAVIATIYENISSGDLEVRRSDAYWARQAKKVTRLLLLSAFSLQILSIFVTTVTGTMLLSRDFEIVKSTTPLTFLRDNFEFEYLTARISFLQGLLNWVAAIALEHAIPSPSQGLAHQRLNSFIAWGLVTLLLFMVSFYNAHMTFYKNYATMLLQYSYVWLNRFVLRWPPRSLPLLAMPSLFMCLRFGWLAFKNDVDKEE